MQGREENERDDDDGQQKKQVRILLRRCRNRGYHVRFGCGQKCVADREEGRRENEIEGKSWNWQRQADVTFGWTAAQSWSSCGEGKKCSMVFLDEDVKRPLAPVSAIVGGGSKNLGAGTQ